MKLLVLKDKKLRKKLYSSEMVTRKVKFLQINFLNSPETTKTSFYHSFFNYRLQKNYSKTKVVKRCLITLRARVMHKNFKISRMKLKRLLDFNQIAGYRKAIW